MTLPPAVPLGEPEHDTSDGLSREPVRRKRRRTTTVVLVLLALATGALAAYLWVTTTQWQASSEAWEADARELGEQVALLEAEVEGATTELEQSREQLATAQDRISALADEKAQLGDENVVSQQYLDYQERVSDAAGTVATALEQCTDAQAQLIGYLEDREAYDPADLDRFASDVDELCQSAKDANAQLQTELEE